MLKMLVLVLLLSVSPRQSFGPTTLHIRVKIEPGVMIVLQVGNPEEGFYTRKDYPNDGLTHEWDIKDVPRGDYLVNAASFDNRGQLLVRATPVSVVVLGRE